MGFFKIALIGTHGTGKTTLAHDLVAGIKKHGLNADFLGEVVRDCPFPINEAATEKAQEWTIFMQYIKEIEMELKCSILVCDRSILDGYIYYIRKFGKNDLLERFIIEKIKTYDLLIKIPLNRDFLIPDGIRSVSLKFQKEIDEIFDDFLIKNNINFYKHESFNKTLNIALRALKNERR